MRIFEGWHVVVLVAVVVLLFGWKRLPDAARSLGRSMRIFKAEVGEMKNDGKPSPSAASGDTVRGERVQEPPAQQPTAQEQPVHPTGDPTQPPAAQAPQAHAQQPQNHQPPA
jgi:sec-independent protein translocase protein TatA